MDGRVYRFMPYTAVLHIPSMVLFLVPATRNFGMYHFITIVAFHKKRHLLVYEVYFNVSLFPSRLSNSLSYRPMAPRVHATHSLELYLVLGSPLLQLAYCHPRLLTHNDALSAPEEDNTHIHFK